jgi:hypothetical protein
MYCDFVHTVGSVVVCGCLSRKHEFLMSVGKIVVY